ARVAGKIETAGFAGGFHTQAAKVPSTLGNGRPYNPACMAGYYTNVQGSKYPKAMADRIPS
ncbi:MAG: hypothetical protein WCO55_06330, partial [Candidatus Falkowbacteria bacterium]